MHGSPQPAAQAWSAENKAGARKEQGGPSAGFFYQQPSGNGTRQTAWRANAILLVIRVEPQRPAQTAAERAEPQPAPAAGKPAGQAAP